MKEITKKLKALNLHPALKGIKDPAMMFDLICFQNFISGQFNQKIPVDSSREAYKAIKLLILNSIQEKGIK